MADYIEKIRNLLALAESPNEHEAKAALLKARELMAKHKISEASLSDPDKQEVARELSGITFSIRRDPWVAKLAYVIAEYHCCKPFQCRPKGKQVSEIGFIGLSGDLTVCKDVFAYAVDCVRARTNKLRRDPHKGVTHADGYGYGFADGLAEAYHKQQNEEGWGLVLTVPKEVEDQINKLPRNRQDASHKKENASAVAYAKGIVDGHKFHEQKRLTDTPQTTQAIGKEN